MNEEKNEEQNTSSVNNDINVDNSSESKPSFSDSIKNIGGALKDNKGYRSRKRVFDTDEDGSNNNTTAGNNESLDIPRNSNAEISTNRINRNRENIGRKALNTAAKVNPIARGVKAVNDVGNTLNNIRAKSSPGRALGMGVSNNITNNSDNDGDSVTSDDTTNTDNNTSSDTSNNSSNTNNTSSNDKPNTSKTNRILDPVPDLENVNPLNNKINFWGLGSVKVKTLLAVGLPLIGILLILIVILAIVSIPSNFGSLLGLDDFLEGGTASSKEEQEYYDNLKRLQEEYSGEGKTMEEASLQIVTAVFSILQTYDPTFGFEDMTYNRMKEVADLLFESVSEEEGGGFRLLDDESTKNNLADYFSRLLPGQPSETYQEMANQVYEYIEAYEEITGEDENESSSSGSTGNMCTYDINGESVSNIKVRLMQAGAVGNLGHCGGTYGEPMEGEELIDFEKYVLGVAYAEVGEAPEEAFKAQLIMARTFALNRPSSMNNAHGLKLYEENGQWILQITNCVSDQVYCDPDQGCSRDIYGGNQYGMVYSGKNHPYVYKDAIPEDSPLREWANEVAGKILVDSNGNLVNTTYTSTTQNNMFRMANSGYDYTDILVNVYNSGVEVTEPNCTSASGDWANWKQYDEAWGSVPVGSSGRNIRGIGCTATSLSILIAKSGALNMLPAPLVSASEFNPGTFVQALNSHNGFTSTGAIYWQNVTTVVPAFKFVGKTTLAGMSKSSKVAAILSELNQGHYCTVEVKGNTGQHWVAVDRVEGQTVYMYDPASNSTDMWSQYNWSNTSDMACYSVGD